MIGQRLVGRFGQKLAGGAVDWAWRQAVAHGTVRHGHRRANAFARFGADSTITFPYAVLHGEDRIEIGSQTTIGPEATLSVGMLVPMPHDGTDPVLTIGDRCQLGKGLSIVAHQRVEIGPDTCAGHYVYITDQNHGYEDVDVPIRYQMWKNAPVHIGAGCWIGHGAVILPGATVGRHVVVAAGSVVGGEVPAYSVVAGAPARVVRRYVPGAGWVPDAGNGA